MPKIDVEEQLKLRFLQPLTACMLRRVVIWHDADGELLLSLSDWLPRVSTARGPMTALCPLTVTLSARCGLLRLARAACLP